ncbi:MAG: hypothetical protein H3C62_05835 [Gemmatimonadaceae bacterium]|nr:hypothetical protein [Gemmatimonadaceae bacterium]
MLAFAAMVRLDGPPVTPDEVARLTAALAATPGRVTTRQHDDVAAVHVAHDVPLEYDRDLPLVDARGRTLFGAVRLDDRDRLRRALRPDDPRALAQASDAQLALHAYDQWGDRFAEHLMGDYAIGIWDPTGRRVVCARDHHGNRQLYWGVADGRCVVSSTLDGVRAVSARAGALRDEAIASFLRDGYVADPQATVWRGVERLPRATTLRIAADGSASLREHWRFPTPTPIRYRDARDYPAHFVEVLGNALRDRLRATDAVIFLSGGMDSTTLAAVARDAAPDVTLHAFTTGAPTVVASDDDRLAPLVAARLGIAHEALHADRSIPLSWLDDRDAYPSQPIDEPELADWRASMRVAAARAPIAIFGEDGDTLLQPPTLLAQLRSQPLAEVVRTWLQFRRDAGHWPWIGLEWRRRLRRALGREPDRTPWLRSEARRVAPDVGRASHPVRRASVRLLTAGLWETVYEGMSPSVTGAASLVTFPLMDPRVIEFVFAIPPVPWGQDKRLLREAMRDRLPPEVVTRPKTPYIGAIEARVAQWRAAGGASANLSERVAPWVDRAQVKAVFESGDPYAVVDAWRVLQLDRWLAREAGHRA